MIPEVLLDCRVPVLSLSSSCLLWATPCETCPPPSTHMPPTLPMSPSVPACCFRGCVCGVSLSPQPWMFIHLMGPSLQHGDLSTLKATELSRKMKMCLNKKSKLWRQTSSDRGKPPARVLKPSPGATASPRSPAGTGLPTSCQWKPEAAPAWWPAWSVEGTTVIKCWFSAL